MVRMLRFYVYQKIFAKIPNNVSYEKASFCVIASIGLQGIRLANPTFGETFSFGLRFDWLNDCSIIKI